MGVGNQAQLQGTIINVVIDGRCYNSVIIIIVAITGCGG